MEFEGIKSYFGGLALVPTIFFATPFVLLLTSLATLPLICPHFWEKNKNKAIVSLALGLPSALFFLYRDWHTLAQVILDYATFMALLGSLFVISGGIYIRGTLAGSPKVNTLLLATGAALANLIGTTGASMLLIRPLLRANKDRQRKSHIVIFFIFIVSNCAGLLTPLGDPPLFLGFLKGVEFGWTLRLWPECLTMVGSLLLIFNLLDQHQFNKENSKGRLSGGETEGFPPEKFGVEGSRNFFLLFVVVALILFSGYVLYPMQGRSLLGESFGSVISKLTQTIGMALIALASYQVTPRIIHERNRFGFRPIIEVAVLFAGIFLAMTPVLLILETQGRRLGITQPWQFFWMSGALSSFLDNAPTYLTFTSLAKGVLYLRGEGLKELMTHSTGSLYLAAISSGAVMMGANTYIGNGPNFMVKAIAEDSKVKMPSFFGYLLWSCGILIPLFFLITFLFFR